MADRFPLIVDSSAEQIQELSAGDNLDLTGSNLINANNIQTSNMNVVGVMTATKFKGDGSELDNLPAGGSSLEATASGTLADGDTVIVNTDGTVSAVDQIGSAWIATLGGITNDFGKGIAVDSSGNVYAVGEADIGGQYDLIIAKYNSSGGIQWQRTLANESGSGIAVDSSGNAYVVGTISSSLTPSGSSDFSIAKYDTDGNIQWQRGLGDSLGDSGYGITVDSSDNVYITGHGRDQGTGGSVSFDGSDDYLTVADSDDFEFGSGNFTLEAFINYTGNPGTGSDTYTIFSKWDNQNSNKGFILRISDDGGGDNLQFFHTSDGESNNITTGSTVLSPGTWYHIAAVRNGESVTFYINGVADSTTHFMGSNSIRNTTVPFRIGGNLDMSASSQEFNGLISNVRVIKGTALYTSNFTAPTSSLTNVTNTKLLCCQSATSTTDAAVTPWTIYAYGNPTASSSNPFGGGHGSDDIIIAKYNSSGAIQSQFALGDSNANYVEAIAVDGSGNIYVTGSTSYGAYYMYTTKLNSSGVHQWTRRIGSGNGEGGTGIAIDSSGNVYVTGKTRRSGATDNELSVVKYDSSGNLLSQVTLGGLNTDRGNGIAIDSSDNVYVVGATNSVGSGHYDYLIVKYNSSDQIEWQRTLGGSSNDQGQDIVVDNSGHIYVIGYSESSGVGNHDFLIAKLPDDGTMTGTYGSIAYSDSSSNLTPGTSSLTNSAHSFASKGANLDDYESSLNEDESFLDPSITSMSPTNLTAENYIGISDGAYSDGQTATVQLIGSVDDAQSSLTPGKKYYVQGDGTLSTTADSPSVLAGTAVAATKLVIKK